MYKNNFNELKDKNKIQKTKTILKAKAYNLPSDVIDKIISKIDLRKQYTITCTHNTDILKKNSYKEDFYNDGYSCNVSIRVILGNFTPGSIDGDQILDPEITEQDIIAFEKRISVASENQKDVRYVLFVYSPINND